MTTIELGVILGLGLMVIIVIYLLLSFPSWRKDKIEFQTMCGMFLFLAIVSIICIILENVGFIQRQ